jgi:hypothetical protein
MFCMIVLPLPFVERNGLDSYSTCRCTATIAYSRAYHLHLHIEHCLCYRLPYSRGYLLCLSLITYIFLDTSVDPWHLYCYYIPCLTYGSLPHVRSSPPIAKCLLAGLTGTPQMVYTLRNSNQRLFTDYPVPCCYEQRV